VATAPALYLGSTRALDGAGAVSKLQLPAHHLVTHGVVLGMTGSGKTGMTTVMIEEALSNGVPVLVVDVIWNPRRRRVRLNPTPSKSPMSVRLVSSSRGVPGTERAARCAAGARAPVQSQRAFTVGPDTEAVSGSGEDCHVVSHGGVVGCSQRPSLRSTSNGGAVIP